MFIFKLCLTGLDKPLLGGVRTTAWARAVRTVCSANPIRSLPARDLPKKDLLLGAVGVE